MARRSDHTREELETLITDTAEQIVSAEGFAALTARRIAKDIGYTPGTLYNIFGSMDGIYLAVNVRTMDKLLEALARPESDAPNTPLEERLRIMAGLYMDFAHENKALWLMLFEYALTGEIDLPVWYQDKVQTLFAPLEDVLTPLFTGKEHSREHKMAARVLWSSVHGICLMRETGKIPLISGETPYAMSDYLIENFIKGLHDRAS
ncbi:MAG: TetR/AcrR family transcriptional regulator [Alphaproteobacteria bacterium]|nr:TetR/AcrR family transcriptional regulator [Alphaproteobacteria bacterium]